jgi:hypothetical protein
MRMAYLLTPRLSLPPRSILRGPARRVFICRFPKGKFPLDNRGRSDDLQLRPRAGAPRDEPVRFAFWLTVVRLPHERRTGDPGVCRRLPSFASPSGSTCETGRSPGRTRRPRPRGSRWRNQTPPELPDSTGTPPSFRSCLSSLDRGLVPLRQTGPLNPMVGIATEHRTISPQHSVRTIPSSRVPATLPPSTREQTPQAFGA